MIRFLAILLYGLVSGLLLSTMRAPAGLDLVHVATPDATTAAFFRAGALFAIALFMDPVRPLFRRNLPVATLLVGAAAGFAFHGLLLLPAYEPASRRGFTLLLVAGTLVLFALSRLGGPRPASDEVPPESKLPPVGLVDRFGFVLLGGGVAIALENLARHLRLLSLGLPEDDTVMGGVLLSTLVVGAAAIGIPLCRDGWQRVLAIAGGLLAIAATLLGLGFIGRAADPDELFRILQSPFGLDKGRIGELGPTVLLSVKALAAPGFLLGAALVGARHPRRLSSLLIGGAMGLVLASGLIAARARSMDWAEAAESAWSFELVASAIALAAVGGAVIGARGPAGRARLVALACVVGGAVVPFLGERPSVWPTAPWSKIEVKPRLLRPLPEGLLTVELNPGGTPAVYLDRTRLTPAPGEEGLDEERIRWSWALLEEERRAEGSTRILFVGQLTPGRRRVLEGLGSVQLERTAPWHAALEDVEAILFEGEEPLAGAPIPPAEAGRRIRSGAYDLVLVAPVHGTLLQQRSAAMIPWSSPAEPVTSALAVPDGTIAVVWIDAASPVVQRHLGEQVLLAIGSGLESLSVGLVLGEVPDEQAPDRPRLLDPGPPVGRPGVLSLLGTRAEHRGARMQAALAARLAASEDPVAAPLAEALEHHFAAQIPTEGPPNPGETRGQQIRLVEETLQALSRAAQEGPPDAFQRRIWEEVAWLLSEKRELMHLWTFVEPVAEAYGPWRALELPVARAGSEIWEVFEEDVLERTCGYFESVLATPPLDVELLREAAIFYTRVGRPGDAARHLRRSLELQPPSALERVNHGEVAARNRLRLLGMALVRLGDPEGQTILGELLRENPDDQELAGFLTEGPLPDPEEGHLPLESDRAP